MPRKIASWPVTFPPECIIKKVKQPPRRQGLKATEHDADEQRLIEEARRDPNRFAVLYETNFDRVYAFVARRVPCREEAEDATAEVFHQALGSLAGFEWNGRPFIAWLLGIAARVLAQRWRRSTARSEVSDFDVEAIATQNHAERQALFRQLLERLPAEQRRVLQHRFFEQRSIREIAQELGRSEGAVKQLQFRALATLRDQMRNRHE
jgi:RNA polymerase sigma-70 factor (ECF subfamily)